ncbi:MAG: Fe-S cluster assembly protein SufD [Planctomycetes bacterium]|nr:Fe-S cluster assembly protein SufD [Planctomycetota bacterium]
MTLVADEKERFLDLQAQFERQQPQGWLKNLRQAAVARFDEMSFPDVHNEDWKFTSLASLLKIPFALSDKVAVSADLRSRLDAETLPSARRLVFVNGVYSAELSRVHQAPSGLTIGGLSGIENDVVRAHLGAIAGDDSQVFTALNTAFLHDAAVVVLPRGLVVAEPIQVFFVAVPGKRATLIPARTLVVAGVNSQAKVLEHYLSVGAAEDVYFTSAVTEFALDDNAIIDHAKIQDEGHEAFHIATTQVQQGRSSTFHSTYMSLGGRLVRNEARVRFTGEGSEATLDGLYLAAGRQHVDNFTVIDHARAHCASHELYKGILRDKAHGVFNGKIFVREDAQKTDAKQTNKVLLLSDEATINTKPQLEIFADDVKCTHGATIGQLDAEGLFYLRSRGIGLEDARHLLIRAFANDIVERMRIEEFRPLVQRRLIAPL